MRGKIICTLAGVVRGAGHHAPPPGGRRAAAGAGAGDGGGVCAGPAAGGGRFREHAAGAGGRHAAAGQRDADRGGLGGSLRRGAHARASGHAPRSGDPPGRCADRLLQPFTSSPDRPITYSAETGNVVIGTPERVAAHPIARIYDVHDLLGPDTAPEWMPPVTSAGYVSGGGFGGRPIGTRPSTTAPAAGAGRPRAVRPRPAGAAIPAPAGQPAIPVGKHGRLAEPGQLD